VERAYVIVCDSVGNYGDNVFSNCCVISEKESINETEKEVLKALKEYIDIDSLILPKDIGYRVEVGVDKTAHTTYYYFVECLELK
jgi:hypothetical protein